MASRQYYLKVRNMALIIGGILLFAIAYYNAWISNEKSFQKFLLSEYSGIIRGIEYKEGDRGSPTVLIGNTEYHFSWEDEIIVAMQIGDSISKRKDSSDVFLFRKSDEGDFIRIATD